jgi:hypothetical protein
VTPERNAVLSIDRSAAFTPVRHGIGNNAHDRAPGRFFERARQVPLEPFANRILAGPESASHSLIDNGGSRAISPVERRKKATAHKRDPKQLKVPVTDIVSAGQVSVDLSWTLFQDDVDVGLAIAAEHAS